MTLLAGTIIANARERHPSFDQTRTSNKVALNFLSAYARELQGKITTIDPEAIRLNQTTALPLAVHANGIALPANRHVVEVVALDSAGKEYPVNLIPATHRLDRTTKAASAWQIGATLYLTSPASLWARMANIAVAYVPIPTPLTTLTGATGTLAVPDTAELCLTERVAAFMAKRAPAEAKVDVAGFLRDAIEAEGSFLTDIANRLTGQMIQTRDVYDP